METENNEANGTSLLTAVNQALETEIVSPEDMGMAVLKDEKPPEPPTKEGRQIEVDGKLYSEAELKQALAKSHAPAAIRTLSEKPTPEGCLRLANCWLKLNKLGSNVEMKNVTPAQVLYLTGAYSYEAGGNPIQNLVETGKFLKITPEQERERLVGMYGDKFAKIFSDPIPRFPETFERAIAIGMKTKVQSEALTEYRMA